MRIVIASVAVALIGIGAEVRSNAVMTFGFSLGVVSGVMGLWRCAVHARVGWSACEIQGSAALVAYFGGAVVTLQTFSQGDFWQSGYMKHADPGFLFLATVLVVLYQTVLTLCGFYENRYWRKSIDSLQFLNRAHNTSLLFFLLVVAIQIYAIWTNQVGFKGVTVANQGQVPVLATLAMSLGLPILGACGYVLGDVRKRFPFPIVALMIVIAIIEFAWSFNFGRRTMMFSVIVFMMTFFWARAGKSIGVKGYILGAILMVFLYVMSNLFIATRATSYLPGAAGVNLSMNMFERMSTGLDRLLEDTEGIQRKQQRNLETRFFVIGYLTDLIGGTGPESALYGTNFISATINAIPRVILPIKADLLREIGLAEGLVNPSFGLSIYDSADSLIAMAYSDFLWFGVIIYPLAVLVLGICIAKITELTVGMPLMTIFFLSFTFLVFIKTESDWTTFLSDFRAALIVIVILMLRQFFLASYHGR